MISTIKKIKAYLNVAVNNTAGMEVLDRLAQLIEPLDDLHNAKGLGAWHVDACKKVAIAAVLHQQAHSPLTSTF